MRNAIVGPLLLLSACTFAADTKEEPKFLQLDFGYTRDYLNKKSATNFKIRYDNRVLIENGKKSKPTELDSSDNINVRGADDGASILFRRGIGSFSGSLLEAFAIRPFKLPWMKNPDVMITGGLNVNMEDDRRIETAIGIQAKPLHIANTAGITNWLTLGLEHSSVTKQGTTSKDTDLIAYRAFAGTALLHEVRPAMKAKLREAQTELNQKADTYEKAKTYLADVVDGTASTKGELKAIFRQFDETERPKDQWLSFAKDYLNSYYVQRYTASRLQAYGEAQGQYHLTRDVEVRRYNSLWATGLIYDFSSDLDKTTFLDIRYERGYLRSDPTKGTGSLILGIGMRF